MFDATITPTPLLPCKGNEPYMQGCVLVIKNTISGATVTKV